MNNEEELNFKITKRKYRFLQLINYNKVRGVVQSAVVVEYTDCISAER